MNFVPLASDFVRNKTYIWKKVNSIAFALTAIMAAACAFRTATSLLRRIERSNGIVYRISIS